MKDKFSCCAGKCAIEYAFTAIEGKWNLKVLYSLCQNGTMRYSELRKDLEITNMTLSTTLKNLEDFGLVSRVQYNEIPPRVEYSVTDIGEKLIPVLDEFSKWGELLLEANRHGRGEEE